MLKTILIMVSRPLGENKAQEESGLEKVVQS